MKLLKDQHFKLRFMLHETIKIWRVKFGESPVICQTLPKFSSAKHSHYKVHYLLLERKALYVRTCKEYKSVHAYYIRSIRL